jgi:hypothetical protein
MIEIRLKLYDLPVTLLDQLLTSKLTLIAVRSCATDKLCIYQNLPLSKPDVPFLLALVSLHPRSYVS